MLRNAVLAMLAALPLAMSAVAQPAPQPRSEPGENLGLGREFGAFDPDRAVQLIQDCESQTVKLRQAMQAWRVSSEDYVLALNAEERLARARRTALDAAYEAETRLRSMSGAQAAQFEADVVQPRRDRVRLAEMSIEEARPQFEAAAKRFTASADETVLFLRSIGLKDSEMAGAPDVILQRQIARCERMTLWAEQSSRVRQQMREPAPISSWPDGAIDGWKGDWSCRWRSTGRDGTVETTIAAHASAFFRDGAVLVHFSTEWVRGGPWPSSHASHIFSPLVVQQTQPTRGAFTNRDGSGEDRAAPDAVDLAAISGDGRLRFQRRYAMQPDRQDDLECVRPR